MENQVKTVILLGVLTAILLWIGSFWGQQGLTFAIIFAVIMNFGSYWFSDKIVLFMYRAKPISEKEAPGLYKLVHEVSHLADLPMPKIYILPTTSPNAFATGRNPKHAAVAVTVGIMDLLSKDELKGVVAHELAHIKNRDTLIQAVAATIAGVIGYIAMMARWGAMFGGFGGRDRDGGRMFELLALAILMPLIATIVRLALSRTREYLADETGAKTIHNPIALANALQKLEHNVKHNPMGMGNETTSSLFIVNPFSAKSILALLSTHPPTELRVKRLKEMA